MLDKTSALRPFWNSRSSYLLVTTGAVIGLGNVFVFPYYVAKHGAGFVLLALLFMALFAVPILLAEVLIGQRAMQNPVGAMSVLALESSGSRHWKKVGWLCFTIMSISLIFYVGEVSFPLSYCLSTAISFLHPNNLASPLRASLPNYYGLSLLVFIAGTFIVVARGINRGLERISSITVPLYFIGLFALACYAAVIGDFKAALIYLFNIHTHPLTIVMVKDALVYAFFTLNIGMGVMMIYGSYLPGTIKLGSSTLLVVSFDIIASLLSYLIIYPLWLVHTNGVMPSTPLNYGVINALFSQTSYPHFLSAALLFIMAIGAWTAMIAMAEGITATLKERFDLSRVHAACVVMVVMGLIGYLSIIFRDSSIAIPSFQWTLNLNFVQEVAENLLTPVAALLIAFFAGWVIKKDVSFDELGFNNKTYYVWLLCVRFIAPLGIGALLWSTFF